MPKIYTDGSAIGGNSKDAFAGWGAVYCGGVLVAKSGRGTNVNAEMWAIRDLLHNLINYRKKVLQKWVEDGDRTITVITDSKTSIQIITGYLQSPKSYDVNESPNYLSAQQIALSMSWLEKNMDVQVEFQHVKGHENELGNNFADYVATTQSQMLKWRWEVENEGKI